MIAVVIIEAAAGMKSQRGNVPGSYVSNEESRREVSGDEERLKGCLAV